MLVTTLGGLYLHYLTPLYRLEDQVRGRPMTWSQAEEAAEPGCLTPETVPFATALHPQGPPDIRNFSPCHGFTQGRVVGLYTVVKFPPRILSA